MPIDPTQLKPAQIEARVEHLDETIVEMEAPNGHLRVFCD